MLSNELHCVALVLVSLELWTAALQAKPWAFVKLQPAPSSSSSRDPEVLKIISDLNPVPMGSSQQLGVGGPGGNKQAHFALCIFLLAWARTWEQNDHSSCPAGCTGEQWVPGIPGQIEHVSERRKQMIRAAGIEQNGKCCWSDQ